MNTKKRVTRRWLLERVTRRWLLGASSTARSSTSAHQLAPSAQRSGILLLVVLSMLTLFLLIGTAFIVSANHYRKTNKILAKQTEASNSSVDQGNLLGEVINQLVRDTNNQNSSLRFHSLLRDMYGNDGILAEIGVVEWATAVPGDGNNLTQGQILQFLLDPATVTDQFGISLNTLNANGNAYNGLVLTFLDGPARGQSVRIVGHFPEPTGTAGIFNARLRVMAPRKANGSNIVAADFANLNTSRILINGRPFNGTGAGYNPLAAANGAKLNTLDLVAGTNRELALMPNAAFFDHSQLNTNGTVGSYGAFYSNQWGSITNQLIKNRLINGMGLVGQGGSDESYDAVDFQNMILALLPTNPGERALPADGALVDRGLDNNLGTADDRPMVIPSLHRPALLNYWRQQLIATGGALENEPNLLRKVLFRPNWLDHPNFTGSNPDFANALSNSTGDALLRMIYGPWDVDNDNDGIRDSVWVDFGAPVMENADGRLVKPMAAILVLDMDGRLNFNAHGSEDIAGMNGYPPAQTLAGGTMSNVLPQGQGYGTAEISLEPLMLGPTASNKRDWYRRFFQGAEANTSLNAIDAANGAVLGPNDRRFRHRTVGKFGQRPNPGNPNSRPLPGMDNIDVFDISAQLKMQSVPRWANGQVANSSGALVLGGYATPPDYRGRYALGLNDLGQPVYEALDPGDLDINNNPIRQNENTPYELDLSLGAARGDSLTAPDGPYTMAELERVLRSYDPDAGALPSRIWKLAGEFKDNANDTTPNLFKLNLWRTTLTTDSYDLPVPSVVVPGWMVETGPNTTTTGDEYGVVMGNPAVGASFADLLEYRIRAEQSPPWLRVDDAANPTRVTQIQQEIRKLLPQDLADGLRLDINRPLGNGRDDNNNGVVDEPGEEEGAFWASDNDPGNKLVAFKDNMTGQFRDTIDRNGDGAITSDYERGTGDVNGDGTTDFGDRVFVHNLRRQMLARDLYVMAMTLVDPLPTAATARDKLARAQRLAQWAINIVDFRDPDNIMTAFEYDANPFDGWNADGSLASPNNDIAGTGHWYPRRHRWYRLGCRRSGACDDRDNGVARSSDHRRKLVNRVSKHYRPRTAVCRRSWSGLRSGGTRSRFRSKVSTAWGMFCRVVLPTACQPCCQCRYTCD